MQNSFYIPASYIKLQASNIGFDACGIAKAEQLHDFEQQYSQWLSLGYNADMHYMEQNVEKRSNPALLYPEAQTVISLAVAYKPSFRLCHPPFVAQYAYSDDYHSKIKTMLFRLINTIQADYPAFNAIPYVDTAPISDKIWAQRCGLGWIGKHTLLINPRLGSWINIGELVCNARSDYDEPMQNHCGKCARCINACPNGAITQNGINANRCIAYHTIENKADRLPDDIDLCGYVFGCDICQKACPYNAQVKATIDISEARKAQLNSIGNADKAMFKKIAKHSAMGRINYSQLIRNIDKTKNKH